jgi:hypothetical protein
LGFCLLPEEPRNGNKGTDPTAWDKHLIRHYIHCLDEYRKSRRRSVVLKTFWNTEMDYHTQKQNQLIKLLTKNQKQPLSHPSFAQSPTSIHSFIQYLQSGTLFVSFCESVFVPHFRFCQLFCLEDMLGALYLPVLETCIFIF